MSELLFEIKIPPVTLHADCSLLALQPATSSPYLPTTQPPTATRQATQAPIKPTLAPTKPASYPVCNAKVTNTPCVQFASIQDAADGESQPGSNVHTSRSKGVVKVVDDITNVKPTALGPDTTLNAIQYQCFNIQRALWYGLDSTMNADGSQTFRKSPFSEVDITFIDHQKGKAPFASCRLTAAGVDNIDKAGMWDDGDFTGAWSLYDGTSFA